MAYVDSGNESEAGHVRAGRKAFSIAQAIETTVTTTPKIKKTYIQTWGGREVADACGNEQINGEKDDRS